MLLVTVYTKNGQNLPNIVFPNKNYFMFILLHFADSIRYKVHQKRHLGVKTAKPKQDCENHSSHRLLLRTSSVEHRLIGGKRSALAVSVTQRVYVPRTLTSNIAANLFETEKHVRAGRFYGGERGMTFIFTYVDIYIAFKFIKIFAINTFVEPTHRLLTLDAF